MHSNPADTRPQITLDGTWTLTIPTKPDPFQVQVPCPWQSTHEELRMYTGRATYTRSVHIPQSWRGKRVFICFGAVDYQAAIYINREQIGTHEGGYTPFEFEIGWAVRFGDDNEIRVEVLDPGKGQETDGLRFEEIPHGKQSWYGNNSGIWQSACLQARADSYIVNITVDTDIDTSTANISIKLRNASKARVEVHIDSPDGASPVPTTEAEVANNSVNLTIPIPNAALWSPESPSLYNLRAELVLDDETIDTLSTHFGMRRIEARNGQILLNGKPIFLAGVLDQDFYPGTEYTIPSDDFLRDQFEKAKHLGLNLMRCHIKVPDPRYLDWCDRLGLLVWYEIPSWMELTDDAKRRGKETLEAMLQRDHNHPSLVIVSIINEAWGWPADDPAQQEWLAGMYDYAKSLEPDRMIVDNSPCAPNFHVRTDIEDYHTYYSIPDQANDYRQWISDFANRPGYTFGGSYKREGWEPLVLSEFGNWGLPRISKLKECYDGDYPWWFVHTGKSPLPQGSEERFLEQGLDQVFGSFDTLADTYQGQEWLALKFQIEEMRKYPQIAGYVITEFTDLHWESNGLLDYCRNPKTFHDLMHTVQDQDILFAQPTKHNWTSGEQVELDLHISHFTDRSLASVRWRVEESSIRGEIEVGEIDRGGAQCIGKIVFIAEEVSTPQPQCLALSLIDSDGAEIAANCADFTIFPSVSPELPHDVLVSDTLNSDILDQIANGANAVICLESPDHLHSEFGDLKAVDRSEQGRWGSWCSSVIWFKDTPAFAGAPTVKTLDFSFQNIIPTCVLDGVPSDQVLSGLFTGWLQNHAAITIEISHGKGRALITTMPLLSARNNDPIARFLLASLARYVARD